MCGHIHTARRALGLPASFHSMPCLTSRQASRALIVSLFHMVRACSPSESFASAPSMWRSRTGHEKRRKKESVPPPPLGGPNDRQSLFKAIKNAWQQPISRYTNSLRSVDRAYDNALPSYDSLFVPRPAVLGLAANTPFFETLCLRVQLSMSTRPRQKPDAPPIPCACPRVVA